MKILPPATEPPREPHTRRHRPAGTRRHGSSGRGEAGEDRSSSPSARSWTRFRQCLRWDFGFTCAFCLLHQADLARIVSEGLGIFTTEHHHPRSEAPEQAGEYSNCSLCCRPCNVSRGRRPVDRPEGRLLDPGRESWSSRFRIEKFEFTLVDPEDRDARRTLATYDLNDPVKVTARRKRAEAVLDTVHLFLRSSATLFRLIRRSSPAVGELDPSDPDFMDQVHIAEETRRLADSRLREFAALPRDRVEACGCDERVFSLPAWLDGQCFEIEELVQVRPAAG